MEYIINLPDYWDKIDLKNNKNFRPSMASLWAFDANYGFLFGGLDENDIFNSFLYRYSFDENIFTLAGELDIEPRGGGKMFYHDNKLYIVGGFFHDHSNKTYKTFPEIIIFDLLTRKKEKIYIRQINKVVQSGICMDKENGYIYIYGGFNIAGSGKDSDMKNGFIKIDIENNNIEPIRPDSREMERRAMMACEVLPDGRVFIFSGFSQIKGKALCHNDYFIYDPVSNELQKHLCNEMVARTGSKIFINSKKSHIVFYGGTYNGMETSGSFFIYDIRNRKFNFTMIHPLPGEIVEPALFYSSKLKKVYIIGGGNPVSELDYKICDHIMILDLKKVKEKW